MTASIRVGVETKERLERLKSEGETWDELLDRLATGAETTNDSTWEGTERTEIAREVIKRSRESFD